MSNGTVQQLSAKGVQDGHLMIAPETSFFKRTYKRHSGFALECNDVEFNSAQWNAVGMSVNLPRNTDLLVDVWLFMRINLLRLATPANETESVYWTNVLGHAMIVSGEINIGSNSVDRVTGYWLEILHELSSDVNIDVDELVLRADNVMQLKDWSANGNTVDSTGADEVNLYVSLPFWFTKTTSQSLPVIALQYHDVAFKFQLRPKTALIIYTSNNTTLHATDNGDIKSASLLINGCFLDALERRLFAANSHEYLIQNIQVSDLNTKGVGIAANNYHLFFNHPVVALYWFVIKDNNINNNDYFNWELTDGRGDDPITTATILFNSSEREGPRGPLFWRVIQPSLYFDRTPRRPLYTYSFSMYPLEWFPSGSANFSRIDDASLKITFRTTDGNGDPAAAANVYVFAQNFNIVRLQGREIRPEKRFSSKGRATFETNEISLPTAAAAA